MPGCAAVGCNNRSEKGYIMKCFPRDPKLRKIWQERVARADWEPSNNSFLCHVHFEPQEWSITQSGRIRLRKNAIPSIFTITSTRKSPKKRTKIINTKTENISLNEYAVEYLENDTEHSSTGQLEEKDSDFLDIDEYSMQSIDEKKLRQYSKLVRVGEKIGSLLQKDNTIEISDDNIVDIDNLVKRDNCEMQLNDTKKEHHSLLTKNLVRTEMSNAVIKEEIKMEVMDHNTFHDTYDEIEERLKQICDGGYTEDENYKNEAKNVSLVKTQTDCEKSDIKCNTSNNERKVALSINVNHAASKKNEIGHILTDKEENIEIIFGTESGDEKTPACQLSSYNKQSVPKYDKINDTATAYDGMSCATDEKKGFNEDIEENFTKDEVHVIPNIRAAMKRKRRTREEIMKSIKKSIRNSSDQHINSSSDSDLSENTEHELEIRHELHMSPQEIQSKHNDTSVETAKFVIKVTGDPDDVTEIIEELSSNAMGTKVSQKFGTPFKHQENDAFVTSVITVLSPKNTIEINDNDSNGSITKDGCITSKMNVSILNYSPCDEKDLAHLEPIESAIPCQSSYFQHSWSDENEKSQTHTCSQMQNLENNSMCCVPYDYEDLLERVKIQEDVIGKLTDQLIIYKELETSFRNKNLQSKEMETASHKINTRSSNAQSLITSKKTLESKQRLIEDLSNRVNYFEEMNKKLMKTVTLESQQKRKLEGQIKQKDNRIKELNWKLEKASKYLERAEKNTNTYRRKMLNMQTIMRRRKLLDEKMTKFNEILVDSSKQEFSDKALAMAQDISKTCGLNGYYKLLSYGFPLPPIQSLRKGYFNDDFTDYNESDVDKIRNSSTKINVKREKMEVANNVEDVDANDSELHDSVTKTEFDGAETVTGTVQDIFDENNDGDDFSTNELREHFILQLNAVM